MNRRVSLNSPRTSSSVVQESSFRIDQKMYLSKIGYAVFPAKIMAPMTIRTKKLLWNGTTLASSRAMPELLKAETPKNMPVHHGLSPLDVATSGLL